MKKKPPIFLTIFMTLLFGFSCTYTLFDKVQEADIFSRKKYESQGTEDFYAEKKSNLNDVLVSFTLFSPFRNNFFAFLSSFFSPNILSVTTSPVLRC